jgi:uracil-DNA glycosylase family 4
MSLDLDVRQRAMLAEMHIPVWWPQAEVPVPPRVVAPAPAPAPVPPQPRAGMHSLAQAMQSAPELIAASAANASAGGLKGIDAPVLRTDAAGAEPDLAALRAAWGACQASQSVGLAPGASPDWLVLGEALGISDEPAAKLFVGDMGLLLSNMLYAVGIQPQGGRRSAQLTSVLKMRLEDKQPADPLAQSAPYLARHVSLLKPKLILALGPFAAQLLLSDTTPLGQLRGRVHQYQGLPVVVSYAPAMLLRNPAEKGKAWADLCLAMSLSV